MNNYYAAVDKDGTKSIYYARPYKTNPAFYCGRVMIDDASAIKGFPNITWDDEPKLVRLTIEVIDEKDE